MFSCSDDDTSEVLTTLNIQLKAKEGFVVEDYSKFQIKLTEIKSGLEYNAKADKSGKISFEVPRGSYKAVAEDLVGGASTMYGSNNKFVLSEIQHSIIINVESIQSQLDKTFVLDELYFNGAKNGEFNSTYYEQYFTIRNISDRILYADGLSVGITADYNMIDTSDEFSEYLSRDTIVLSQIYTIPGNGRTYKIEPNESLVIALSAINHKEGGDKPKSIDLSGADFEIFVDYEYVQTVDNPDVPNLDVNYSVFQAFSWQYSGGSPMVLLRLDDLSDDYINQSKVKLGNPASMGMMKQDFLRIPTSSLIDGVETGTKDSFYDKVLPNFIDKSSIQVEGTGFGGGFDEQFIKRKEIIDNDGNKTVQDTNDSSKDFEIIVGGQKSYPKNK
jgi:hypothetical protein